MKISVLPAFSVVVVLFLFVIKSNAYGQTFAASNIPHAGSTSAVAAAYGKVPLSFEANEGQVSSQVRFLARGCGYALFLTDAEAVLALSSSPHTSDVIRIRLAGAQSGGVRMSSAETLSGSVNYLLGNDPANWRLNVPTYAKVRYEGVYPGVDLVYYGNQRNLEYDFVIAPNASPKSLRVRILGAQRLRLTRNGDLAIVGEHGQIAFHKPLVYQVKHGVRQPIRGGFQLLTKNAVGFRLGRYDHARALVIDPELAYSTYLGASDGDVANAIAVDAAGDAYVVGGTESPDFPVTPDAFQRSNHGMAYDNGVYLNNAFVTKFNPAGSELIYSTYLGGTTSDESFGNYDGDIATGVAVDAAGNAYVTGYTSAYDFPVTSNAPQKVNKSYILENDVIPNAFVSKLNATGSGLVYSTYLGGTGNILGENPFGDYATGIAVDSAGSAYVVGTTFSADFPITGSALQKTNNAFPDNGSNLFVAKFNPAGSALDYSTYLGGSGIFEGRVNQGDTGSGIATDSAGNAYVTGSSISRDYPVTSGAYQTVNHGPYSLMYTYGGSNAVISKLNANGTSLIYSSYLGGSSLYDQGLAIAVNSGGNAYVTGIASSADFPVTTNAFQKVNGDPAGTNYGSNAFVTELNQAGSGLIYSTFLGGSSMDAGHGIALDAFGSAYVTGITDSTNFPVTADAFRQFNHSAAGNAFVSKLNPAGSALIYSSYIGGSGGDSASGIAVDAYGSAYLAGNTCSTNLPVTGEAFQSTNLSGGCEGFAAKFRINAQTQTTLNADSNPGNVGVKIMYMAAVTATDGSPTPTGSVTFSVDGRPELTEPLDDTGHAQYANSKLAAGRYNVTASYSGNAIDAMSGAAIGELIIGSPTRVTVQSGRDQTTTVGAAFPMPLVALVQDVRGAPVPGALVTFSGAGLSFGGNSAVTDAKGKASIQASATGAGSLTAIATVAGVSTSATFKLTATPNSP